MTRYAVVWHEGAVADLAELWISGSDRHAIADAAQGIDELLREDAPIKGIEISEGLRAIISPPLRALFVVRADDRLVEVLRVRSL